jgi:hypothetical protein
MFGRLRNWWRCGIEPAVQSPCETPPVCAGKAGEVLRMKESYDQGLASHVGPESCGGVGNGTLEALTGVRAGRVSSPESVIVRGADGVQVSGRQHRPVSAARETAGPCGIKDPEHARKHFTREAKPPDRKPGDPRADPERRMSDGARAVNPKGERRR